jgi:hypothetical protein
MPNLFRHPTCNSLFKPADGVFVFSSPPESVIAHEKTVELFGR